MKNLNVVNKNIQIFYVLYVSGTGGQGINIGPKSNGLYKIFDTKREK